MSFDSEGKRRTQLDTGWADPQGNQAYRVTGAFEDSDTFRDDGYIFQDKYQRVFSQNYVAQVPVYRDALVPVPEHATNLSSKGTNVQQTTGLYLQDMIELNEHRKALVGVRYDIFGQEYDDNRVQNVDLDRTLTPRNSANV